MNKQQVYSIIDDMIQSAGYDLMYWSEIIAQDPDNLKSFEHNTTFGISQLNDGIITINDKYTPDEQFFTKLHEMAHLICKTSDEDVADNVARFCCTLITALTGITFHTEALTGIPAAHRVKWQNGNDGYI